MVTIEMLNYLGVCSRKTLVDACRRNDHNGEWDGCSRTVAALTILKWVIENEMDYVEFVTMF